MERMFSPDYVQRGPGRRLGKKDGFLDLPKIPLNLAAKQYLDPEGKYTLDYLEYTGLTEKDLAQVGLAPMKPAGKIFRGKGTEPLYWGIGREVEIGGKMVQVFKARDIRKRGESGPLMVKMKGRKSELLSVACERAAEETDAFLRERGYLPKMPQKTEAIQGRR